MSESLSNLEDVFADLAIGELYELHIARGSAEGMSEEEAALAAQSLHTSDPDGFLMNAKLLMEASIETQAGWIRSEGITDEDALARWELMRDYEPLLIVGFVKAFYALKNGRIADQ